MPRIIFKCPYLKGGSPTVTAHLKNLVGYIATRDGAEKIDPGNTQLAATNKQKELVDQLVQSFPESMELFEYEDYLSTPNRGNASAFITMAIEQNLSQLIRREKYLEYIAKRPRAQRFGAHGLFTGDKDSLVLSQTAKAVAEHPGNVWLPIISLRREDAARLGYDNAENWKSFLSSYAMQMATAMKIPWEQFRWYAAFHNESHHPHIHMVCYSADPAKGFLTKTGIAQIKSGLAKHIFRQELTELYQKQTKSRNALNEDKADPKNLAAKAKAEKYSKILAKTLINTSGGDSAQYGQNAFFYDSAEGLLTAMFLLVAEYLPTEDADGNPIEKRHVVSVFKLVQELLAPSRVKGKNQFQLLLEKLPPNHKARWFAGSALNTAEQAMASVISTVLSRLNAFLDSEMEQILCFDTAIDAEKFCNEKSAIFIVLPEEDQTKYFMVSLILQNLYREILTVADENGGRLKNRVVFFADELGTCPPIQSLELMFSASRSRGLMLVPIVQSITGQLQKNYGKEGSEIIVDNCQVNLYGGFAPASQTAVELSKSLGSRTVMSGSISRGKNDPSQSLQMMERPLMTPDELKSMPKGSFIVAKTGVHPMKVKLRLFLDWGIRFRKPYEVPEKAQRSVAYADKQELEESIIRRHYGTIVMDSEQPQGGGTSAGGMAQGIQAAPDSRKTVFRP